MRNISESNTTPILVVMFILWAISIMPFKIVSYGYMPPDDASRHAAKVISGKDWNQILVLRDDVKMDSHAGWHAILGAVYKITKWDAHSLVLFSVIFLFILFSTVPVLLLKRPEAWPIALLVIVMAEPAIIFRLVLGRPYIVTMAVIIVIGILWPRLRDKKIAYGPFAILTLSIALSTWVHCGWYLFILPIACFYLAREWRAGFRLFLAVLIGVLIGSALTGHPYLFLKQTLHHVFLAFGNTEFQRMLVSEFQPFLGDFFIVILVVLMMMWRALRGAWNPKVIDNPIFMLAVLCWALGFVTRRVWIDMGIAAVSLWIAQEFQEFLISKMSPLSWRRLLVTIVSIGILYSAITNDAFSRWSENKPPEYLSLDNADQAPWLPEPGGILYSDTMDIFYQTFFKNPHAPWRYILGFEPAIMPPEDLAIYRDIQLKYRAFSAFEPWVKKMRPQDRLILRHRPGDEPKIPGLEWHYAAQGTWIGRLPKDTKQMPVNGDK